MLASFLVALAAFGQAAVPVAAEASDPPPQIAAPLAGQGLREDSQQPGRSAEDIEREKMNAMFQAGAARDAAAANPAPVVWSLDSGFELLPPGQPPEEPPQSAPTEAAATDAAHAPRDATSTAAASETDSSTATPYSREPLTPVDDRSESNESPRLLRRALTPPVHGALAGRPITLFEAIGGSGTRAAQQQTVTAYWELAIATGRYHFALREQEELVALAPPETAASRAVLAAAQAAARARLRSAELEAVTAQHRLAEASLSAGSDIPPLAVDAPLVGVYRTNFQSLFAARPAPAELRRIDRTLPLQLAAIDSTAVAAATAEQAFEALAASCREGATPLTAVLEAHGLLRQQRSGFLDAVLQYNLDIARYALAVVGGAVGPETVVSMLIGTTPQTSSVLVPQRHIAPTAAVAPLELVPLGGHHGGSLVIVEPTPMHSPPDRLPMAEPGQWKPLGQPSSASPPGAESAPPPPAPGSVLPAAAPPPAQTIPADDQLPGVSVLRAVRKPAAAGGSR